MTRPVARGRRSARHLLLASLMVASMSASARAATLGFTGTLTLHVIRSSSQPGFGTFVIPGSGVAQVTGTPHLSSWLLPAGAFGPLTTAIDHYAGTVASLRLTGVENLGGSFAGASGSMGLQGVAKLCLFTSFCGAYLPFPISATGTPLVGLGIGGTQSIPGSVSLTAQHAPWALAAPALTIHAAASTITTPTLPVGFVHGPASGSLSSAAQPSGVVQLVTATKLFTSLTSAFPELPMWSALNLHFVPEPSLLALLASAAAVVLAVARRRT